MNPYNGFILSMILLLPVVRLAQPSDQSCQEMKLEVKVGPASDQGSTITITSPKDARLRIFLMAQDGSGLPAEVQLTNGELRNVARGQYEIIVQDLDKRYCSELKKITVN